MGAAALLATAFAAPALAADAAPATHAHEAAPAADASGIASGEAFNMKIPNIPGKSLIAYQVDFAPGEKGLAHRHEKSAFIMAYVVSGSIRSQVEGLQDEPKVYHAGESWYELPDAHHLVSDNASDTEPARLLAVFVVDTDHEPLTTIDKH